VDVYTIGFTTKTAAEFFGALRTAGIRHLIDVRLNNSSQVAGFTKRRDLPFLLAEICQADYTHEPLLAPTPELLQAYRKGAIVWDEYARLFHQLITERRVEERLDRATFAVPTALLCSEPTADRCHRRLVVEYLEAAWGGLQVVHL
jgi:uncharacterized protein (DUF488 family)